MTLIQTILELHGIAFWNGWFPIETQLKQCNIQLKIKLLFQHSYSINKQLFTFCHG